MPKDKVSLVVSIIAISFFVLMLIVAGVMLFRIYLKRKNKLILEKKLMGVQFEQTLLQSKLEIQEQTFRDISQELHDNIAQVLSLISISLNSITAPGNEKKITQIDELLTKALGDLRTLSHSLDGDYIRTNGWQGLVQRLMTTLQNTGRFTTELDIEDNLPALGDEKPIILFRMIQEVINNIMKHAQANTIYLNAKNNNGQLLITIRDNGKGFTDDKVRGGAGLHNLENRAKIINAQLAIDSQSGAGTIVSISITP